MCGIAGIFDLRLQGRVERPVLEAMTAAIVHRGRTSAQCFMRQDVGLGVQRLPIVDPAGGAQPVLDETGDIVCVCNGEIYNHEELRRRLSAGGHRFRSRVDVEVIPHLYEERGAACVDQLDGQFALAIYDGRCHRLLLARDPFGVNPLFYTTVDGLVIFGSEIKAILAHAAVPRVPDLTGLDQVISFPGLVSPTTMFKGIYSLPHGHRLLADSNGVRVQEYWDLEYPTVDDAPGLDDEPACVRELDERLRRAIAKRLQGEVEVGCYLSGGLDSSLVASIAARLQPDVRRHSFSISFPGQERSEAPHQHTMAEHLGTIHHDVPFSPRDVAASLEAVVYHCECPIKETYNTACLALSATAREHGVSVVLTGQGADELFAGYIGYRFDALPPDAGGTTAPVSPRERAVRSRLWGEPALAFEGNYASHLPLKRRLYSGAVLAQFEEFNAFNALPINRDRIRRRHPLHQRAYLDFKLRLVDHLLSDHGDKMTMANAVEGRHPFLDRDVVALVRQLAPEMKLKGFTEKYIVKKVAERYLPAPIVNREKFGWHAPGTPELLQSGDEWTFDHLSCGLIKRQGVFNPETVEELKRLYAADGYRINHPIETDLLAIVLSCAVFLDRFNLTSVC
jgi:asparagine synthase (glutamine-hydrolysing)